MSQLSTIDIINKIFRDSETLYGLTEFSDIDVKTAINIFEKDGKFFLKCFVREKDIQVFNPQNNSGNPEEIVRQFWLYKLLNNYKYPKDRIEIEKDVHFGHEIHAKGIDIVIYHKDKITPHIVIELKKPKEDQGIEQLKSYLSAEGAPIGVWSNGETSMILYRPYPREYETLRDIPRVDQTIDDVLEQKMTLKDLTSEYDLKKIILALEELVLAGSGADSFTEIFKIIYAKLYDEKTAKSRPDQELLFRKSKDSQVTYQSINTLFTKAIEEWPGIFNPQEKIELSPHHLSICIAGFEEIRLLGAKLEVMDSAFEHLLTSVAKGAKGQYFTPRNVVDMAVKMINPKNGEYILDPACGSGGFLIHAMWWVWQNSLKDTDKEAQIEYARRYVFGIDFDDKSAKIARALMLIAGDGKSHILKLNSLDPREWQGEEREKVRARAELQDLTKDPDFHNLKFDCLLTNPPFAGEIKDQVLLRSYDLGKNEKGKLKNKVERHILFIERCLDMLKPGGRMAIVLPQGILNNTQMQHIRQYLFDKAQILAVVGLHGNTFKPHTGVKTSILFLRKWQENEEIPKDYPIFMAVSQKGGKDNSGDKVYMKDEKGDYIRDSRGQKLIDDDLSQIADEFIKFAKDKSGN